MGRRTLVLWGKLAPGPADCNKYCRLCWGGFDTGAHALGPCRDVIIHGMITMRHNEVVRRITRAVKAGDLGGCFMLVHAGRATMTMTPPNPLCLVGCCLASAPVPISCL